MLSKQRVISLAVVFVFLLAACHDTPPNPSLETNPTIEANAPVPYVEYKPPILPLKLVFQSSGVTVQGEKSIVTPLGVFTIGASLPIINNNQVLIILRDTKKGSDILYRINSGRKIRITVDGKTAIEINPDGVIVIDITNSKVESIEITDKNHPTGDPANTIDANISELSSPNLGGSPKEWLASPGEIPSALQLIEEEETSNEFVAKKSDNPTETLALLQKDGRLTGYSRDYGATGECDVKGLVLVHMSDELYTNPAEAKHVLEQDKPNDKRYLQRIEDNTTVGEAAYTTYAGFDMNDCNPPFTMRLVAISFRRYNTIGDVYVAGVEGTVSDEYMLSLVTRLAQLMDANFATAVK